MFIIPTPVALFRNKDWRTLREATISFSPAFHMVDKSGGEGDTVVRSSNMPYSQTFVSACEK